MIGEKPCLNITYTSTHQIITIGITSDGHNVSPSWHIPLGDLLNTASISAEECQEAISSTAIVKSPPSVFPFEEWGVTALPDDLLGKTVLDIGGYNGFMAKAALDRGAIRATVVDNMQFLGYTLPAIQHGWPRPPRIEGVEYVLGDLRDFSTWPHRAIPTDLVICFNVIYHVADPLGCIERLRSLTKGDLLLCTSYHDGDHSAWDFTPDPSRTIFLTPTVPGLVNSLEYYGFSSIQEIGRQEQRIILKARGG